MTEPVVPSAPASPSDPPHRAQPLAEREVEPPKRNTPGWPAACDEHASVPAWAACARCGRFVCRACHRAEPETDHALCPRCLQALVAPTRPPGAVRDEGAPEATDDDALANDEPRRVADYPRTARRLLTGPSAFFARLHSGPGPLVQALGFGVVCGAIGLLAGMVWGKALGEVDPLLLSSSAESGLPPWMLFLGMLAALPLAAGVQILVFALALLLILRVLRVERASFESLLRISSYSMLGSVFVVLPVIGGFLAILAQVLLLQIGVRRGLDAPYDKTFIAVLVTVLVLGMLGVAVA